MVPEVPKSAATDKAHAAAKAVLSLIPYAGGPAVELFQSIVQPPLEKRRTEWMERVAEQLEELRAKGVDLDTLQHNVDLGAQNSYLIATLEEHKNDFKKGVSDEA